MSGQSQIACVRIYPLSIPLRRSFTHAARARQWADPVVVQIELADHTAGYGETLPRRYVSGESVASVIAALQDPLLEELLLFRPASFPEALEKIEALPTVNRQGQLLIAARAAVELALLDAYSRHFHRPISAVAGWLGLPGFGPPGSAAQVRYSGVLSGDNAGKLKSSIRKMRWFGLRDFKLKVGFADDVPRIRSAAAALGKSLGHSTTLRLDANGAWSLPQAVAVLQAVRDIPISCVEQPLAREHDEQLLALQQTVPVRIMHDESLVTLDDARRLRQMAVADAFNIRLSKNGGFLAALQLAHFAAKHNIPYQLGCMVGETSILSAAGRRFLENTPQVLFAEGSYGKYLLRGDVTDRPVQFGCGGKVKPLDGAGWGVEVRPELLQRYAENAVIEIPL